MLKLKDQIMDDEIVLVSLQFDETSSEIDVVFERKSDGNTEYPISIDINTGEIYLRNASGVIDKKYLEDQKYLKVIKE